MTQLTRPSAVASIAANDSACEDKTFWTDAATDQIFASAPPVPSSELLRERRNTPAGDPERQLGVDLLARVAVGDEAALAAFYERFSPVLYGMALKIVVDEHEAEDVLQEAFIYIWRKAANYNALLSSPFTWAVMILRHKAIDRLRSRIRVEKLAARAADEFTHALDADESSAEEPFFREQQEIVRAALKRLNAEQRQALDLAFFSGLTHEEIALQLATPLGTIKTRIRRALIQLRDMVKETR